MGNIHAPATIEKSADVPTSASLTKHFQRIKELVSIGFTAAAIPLLTGCDEKPVAKEAPVGDVAPSFKDRPIVPQNRLIDTMTTPAEMKETDLRKIWQIKPLECALRFDQLNPEVIIDTNANAITLRNGGLVATQEEFGKDGGTVRVSGTLKLVNSHDEFKLVLHTDERRRAETVTGIANGLAVRFLPTHSFSESGIEIINFGGEIRNPFLGSVRVPMETGKNYKFDVVYNERQIDIYWENGKEPVLSIFIPPDLSSHFKQGRRKIALCNGNRQMEGTESTVQDLRVVESRSRPREDLTIRSRE